MRAPVCEGHSKHNQTEPTRVCARYRRFYVRIKFRAFTWAGWPDVHSSARAPRATGRERVGNDGPKPQPPTKRGVCAKESRPTAWGGARRELAAQTTAPSTQRAVKSALWAVGWFSTGQSARAPRATGRERVGNDGSKPQLQTRRGVCAEEPRPTAWGGARCEFAAQTTAPRTQRTVRALWPVGWFSTWRRARASRATGREKNGYDGPTPQPPTWRVVYAEDRRPTAWGGARRELAAQTTAPSTLRAVHALWAVGWFST